MSDPLELTTQLARRAGKVLMDAFRIAGTCASFKSDHSFVTQTDVAVDHLVTTALQENFPGEAILSEELQTYLSQPASTLWVIDPLDGTTNYCLGLPVWGVLITRLKNGLPEMCVQYFPLLDELYSAQRGQGAWLNGVPISVGPPDPNQPYGFFACCSRTHRLYNISLPHKARILGSAAYTFCMLARGAALVGFEATPKIWDIAGAWLLVQEAGGAITPLEGLSPFPVVSGQDYSQRSFPTLGASTLAMLVSAQSKISRKI
jgi:myo-inositol-1(or 4)-monophosphatase